AEQNPADWWQSVVEACQQLDSVALAAVAAVGFSTARETFALVRGDGQSLGPAIVWSDRRAASPQAKLSWLADHEPQRWKSARWVMAPRDLVVFELTGRAVTDRTVAARAGFVEPSGSAVDAGETTSLLPTVLAPSEVVGPMKPGPAAALGLSAGLPVV